MTKKHETPIDDDSPNSAWHDKFSKADTESMAAEERPVHGHVNINPEVQTPTARISLAPVVPDHVRDALAHTEAHSVLDAMAVVHGPDAVKEHVKKWEGDPNYGNTAKAWLSKP